MKFPIIYVGFVDTCAGTGPGVNEFEFVSWLGAQFGSSAAVILPTENEDVSSVIQFSVGHFSLKNPIRHVARQIRALLVVCRIAKPGAIVYYRHSRLVLIVPLLRIFRSDLHLVAHRLNGVRHADAGVGGTRPNLLGRLLEFLDWSIRKFVARSATWVDCVTQVQAEALSRVTGKVVRVVPNGVNVSRFAGRSKALRVRLGLPADKVIIGFCGGFPFQRGALQVLQTVKGRADCFGVIIGKLNGSEERQLKHPRVLLVGQLPFADVPRFLACFDIGMAFDDVARADLIGNSNQKIRQYLAAGAFVITRKSDIDFEKRSFAGIEVADLAPVTILNAVEAGIAARRYREQRREFAREHLDVANIFGQRHAEIEAIVGGLHGHG